MNTQKTTIDYFRFRAQEEPRAVLEALRPAFGTLGADLRFNHLPRGAMGFQQASQIWRPLGRLQDGTYLGFPALTAIHYTHRLMAYLVLLALAWLAWRLHRDPATQRQARWLGGLTLLQFATGLSNVVLGWPMLAAVGHTGGAAALVVVLTWIVCSRRSALAAEPRVSFAFSEPAAQRPVR